MQRANHESVSEGTAPSPRLKSTLLVIALLSGLSASAQTSTITASFTDGRVIPDTSTSGLASTRMVSTPITRMTDLNVTMKVKGTFNSDLYAYLVHGSGRTVLLNRLGNRADNNRRSGDAGLDVTFDDGAAQGDAHGYRHTITGGSQNPAPLTGAWAPDGRTTSPLTVLDTDTRPALLNSFNGLNPNGEWVLFIADLKSGDIHTLESWGLEITGYTTVATNTAPASTPNMLPIVMNGSIPTVRFGGIPGFTYHLERTSTLSPASWQPVGGPITVPASGIAEYPDPTAPAGSAFYRTVSAAQP